MAGDGEDTAAAGLLLQAALLWAGRALLLLLLLLGAAANGVALLAFCRGPGLRTLSNRFVMNLLVVNLVASAALLPLVILDSALDLGAQDDCEALSGPVALCSLSEGVAAGYCTASILGVLLIAVDQYYAVVDPLRYHSKVDAVRSVGMLVGAWLCAGLAGVLGALDPRGTGLWTSCRTSCRSSDAVSTVDSEQATSLYRQLFTGGFAVFVFLVPFTALCWIYVSIYGAAHRNSQRTRRNGSGSVAPPTPPPELNCAECRTMPSTPSGTLNGRVTIGGLPVSRSAPSMDAVSSDADLIASRRSSLTSSGDEPHSVPHPILGQRRRSSCPHAASGVTVTISPPPSAPPTRSASACFVSSLRCRISNASLFRYREEGRAARVSALVVVMALGCWSPFVAVLGLHAALPGTAPAHLDALALAALAAAVCISPCLFAYRNRRVQKEVRRMLCAAARKGSLERSRGRGVGPGALTCKGRSGSDTSGSARRLLPPNYSHTALNLMASLAEDCNTPSDSTSALTISAGGKSSDDDASALTVSVSLLPTLSPANGATTGSAVSGGLVSAGLVSGAGGLRDRLDRLQALVFSPRRTTFAPAVHLLPEDALAVDTARSSFSSGASSSQGSAASTDTSDE